MYAFNYPSNSHCVSEKYGWGSTYHTPPQSISVAAELCESTIIHGILLCQIHEVGREDEPEESDIKSCDQLLKRGKAFLLLYDV